MKIKTHCFSCLNEDESNIILFKCHEKRKESYFFFIPNNTEFPKKPFSSIICSLKTRGGFPFTHFPFKSCVYSIRCFLSRLNYTFGRLYRKHKVREEGEKKINFWKTLGGQTAKAGGQANKAKQQWILWKEVGYMNDIYIKRLSLRTNRNKSISWKTGYTVDHI